MAQREFVQFQGAVSSGYEVKGLVWVARGVVWLYGGLQPHSVILVPLRVIYERTATLHVWTDWERHAFQFRRPAPTTPPMDPSPRDETPSLENGRSVPPSRNTWHQPLEGVAGTVHLVALLPQLTLTKRPHCRSVKDLSSSAAQLPRVNPAQGTVIRVHTILPGLRCCWFTSLRSSIALANPSDGAVDLVRSNSSVAPAQPIERCCAVLGGDTLASPKPSYSSFVV